MNTIHKIMTQENHPTSERHNDLTDAITQKLLFKHEIKHECNEFHNKQKTLQNGLVKKPRF